MKNISGSDTCTPTSFEKFWYANHPYEDISRHLTSSSLCTRNCAEVSISPKRKSSLDGPTADSVNKPSGGRIKPGKLNTGSNKPKRDKVICKKNAGGKRRPKDEDGECGKTKPNQRSKKAGSRHKIHNRMKMVPH